MLGFYMISEYHLPFVTQMQVDQKKWQICITPTCISQLTSYFRGNALWMHVLYAHLLKLTLFVSKKGYRRVALTFSLKSLYPFLL